MWFYEKEPDTTPITDPISYDIVSFIASHRTAGYYYCYGKFPQEDRFFLSMATVQVNGKL